jgi:hypothetical protein
VSSVQVWEQDPDLKAAAAAARRSTEALFAETARQKAPAAKTNGHPSSPSSSSGGKGSSMSFRAGMQPTKPLRKH